MGIFQKVVTAIVGPKENSVYRMITVNSDGLFAYNGKLYESDIVRSAIRPYAKAMGKAVAKHILKTVEKDGTVKVQTNPQTYIRVMLEDPNPYMNLQKLCEKMAVNLKLNGNAFALIVRDENGLPRQLYPLPAQGVRTKWLDDGTLGIQFVFSNGNMPIFKYSDLIHLRADFYQHDILGDPIAPALIPLMECVGAVDRSLVEAIKNSAVIKWILKLSGGLRSEDRVKAGKEFAENYLQVQGGTGIGVAVTDAKGDLKQVEPKNYVPEVGAQEKVEQRVYKFFNINEAIVKSEEKGDAWNAYYEREIEPDIRQMSEEFTRKIFSQRQRAFGNSIVFEAYNMVMASLKDKMQLQAMVDRGALTANEWRETFNLGPIEGGDVPIRRLDTAVVNQVKNLANRIQGKDPETDREIIKTINTLIEGRVSDARKQSEQHDPAEE